MTPGSLLSALHIAAATNGLLVAAILIFSGKRSSARARWTLGGFLAAGSTLLAIFVLLDTGILVFDRAIGVVMEALAAILPALYLDYVLTATGHRGRRAWLYLPVPVFTVIAAIHVDFLSSGTDFAGAILLLALAVAVSAIVYARRRTSLPRDRLAWLIAFMIVFQLAQMARLAWPQSEVLFDLVPLIGTLGVTIFVVFTLIGSRTLTTLVTPPVDGRIDPDIEAALAGVSGDRVRLAQLDLSLETLAAQIGVSGRKLSAYLAATRGYGFRDWLKAERIALAAGLLADPAERRTSIEAIGLMSGFASRSAFYVAFRDLHGVTPAQFRQRQLTE
ncbi:helix-turn-helix transcriptional regulator [Hyphobacterium sp.]|uniref:helix-turn-helix transcriptional regulator n=1 Tax=Hyphobacterium sp. TaxID=2004662 RepID=UPI003B5229EB